MARYTGPKTKLSRRFGIFLVGSPKHFERRSYPPGMHGQKGMRRKTSEYGLALLEKQKPGAHVNCKSIFVSPAFGIIVLVGTIRTSRLQPW